jgi:hypothetical protein
LSQRINIANAHCVLESSAAWFRHLNENNAGGSLDADVEGDEDTALTSQPKGNVGTFLAHHGITTTIEEENEDDEDDGVDEGSLLLRGSLDRLSSLEVASTSRGAPVAPKKLISQEFEYASQVDFFAGAHKSHGGDVTF